MRSRARVVIGNFARARFRKSRLTKRAPRLLGAESADRAAMHSHVTTRPRRKWNEFATAQDAVRRVEDNGRSPPPPHRWPGPVAKSARRSARRHLGRGSLHPRRLSLSLSRVQRAHVQRAHAPISVRARLPHRRSARMQRRGCSCSGRPLCAKPQFASSGATRAFSGSQDSVRVASRARCNGNVATFLGGSPGGEFRARARIESDPAGRASRARARVFRGESRRLCALILFPSEINTHYLASRHARLVL